MEERLTVVAARQLGCTANTVASMLGKQIQKGVIGTKKNRDYRTLFLEPGAEQKVQDWIHWSGWQYDDSRNH